MGQHGVRYFEGVLALATGAQQDGDQLRIRESGWSLSQQTFARTIFSSEGEEGGHVRIQST
jgi:hypothetical protein